MNRRVDRYVPGTSADYWTVVLDTTNGRYAIRRRSEDGAYAVLGEWRKHPRGTGAPLHWTAVSAVLLDPRGEALAAWGPPFDPDSEPRWPALASGWHEGACTRCGTRIPAGWPNLDGLLCAPCAYADDGEDQRPVKIRLPDTMPPVKKAAANKRRVIA